MDKQILILLLEDNASDAELIRQMLVSQGLNPAFEHVESREGFEAVLRSCTPDLIISDYSLPNYNGKAALAAAQLLVPGTPFIFYSGTIGEEAAIETLKSGATDYVLKDKPARLISAVRRALAESDQSKRQRDADERIAAQAQLLDLATDAIIVRDLEDRIEFWNQGAERLYGFNRDEVLGKKFYAFTLHSPADVFSEAKRITLQQGRWAGEKEEITKDGKAIVVMSRWTLVRDQRGEPRRILAINTDITERKRLEKQFLRAQRLESVGTLASGIAHDLNNVLAPVLMACEVLKDLQPSREAAEMLEMAEKSARHGASIVSQLLTFVRGGTGKRTVVPTGALLEEICTVLRQTIPGNIRIRSNIDPTLPPIHADPTQLHQVLMNLCVNARDAMPKGGTLTITAAKASDRFILIRVADTGTGIPADILDKIFDPFFTTKEPEKGTGLGLSTVMGIVRSHGGKLKVESQEGEGTCFEITFPAASATAASERRAPDLAKRP